MSGRIGGGGGALVAIPVVEGGLLFNHDASIDSWPIGLDTQDGDENVETVRRIAPVFGGINLEDISAPRCFEIEEFLQNLGKPRLSRRPAWDGDRRTAALHRP